MSGVFWRRCLQGALIALSSVMAAGCGGGQGQQAGAAEPGLRAAQGSPVGRWAGDRHHRLILDPKGWYAWEQPLPCELPPCKTRVSEGRYALEGANRIKLGGDEGAGEVLIYRLTPDGHLRFKQSAGGPAYELSAETDGE